MSEDLLAVYMPNAIAGAVLRGNRAVRTTPILRALMGMTRAQCEVWCAKRGATCEIYRPLDTRPHLAYEDHCPATLLE